MSKSVETWTARTLSVRISKTLGRTVSPKQVRGRSRGDSGTPVLARYGADQRGAYASHVYTPAEADRIGAAFVTAHNKRTGGTAKWAPIVSKRASKPAEASSKPAAATKGNKRVATAAAAIAAAVSGSDNA